MLYVCFDQASNETGFSVFEDGNLLEYGKINTKSNDFMDKVIEVQNYVFLTINEMIDKYKPKNFKVVFEDIQLQHRGGVDTFKKLAQLQGVLIVSVMRNFPEVDIEIVHASSWKSTAKVRGRGRAEQKRNAQARVLEMFNVKATQDECDAILIGYHASTQELNWE